MSRRVAALVLAAAQLLVACDPTSPTTSPSVTGSTRPAPSASSAVAPSGIRSAEPSAAVQIDDPAYLAGDTFMLRVGDAGAHWSTPATAPVMPNGEPAVRVAFLPASCATGDFLVQVGAGPPKDAWEVSLGESEYSSMSVWPSAQLPECADGQGRTYLELGYHPLSLATIHLVASRRDVGDAPAEVELVPVYTSADASQPSLTMSGVIGLEPRSGPKKPRKSTAQEVVSTTFARATLPDGTAPDHWGFRVTGCAFGGPTWIDITARIGSAEPIAVGQCSEGTFSTGEWSWPLPADGTPIAVLMAGGTTKSFVQVAEFQWRGDRN